MGNGQWVKVGAITTSNQDDGTLWSTSNLRFYATAEQLEEVYGTFGFSAENYKANFDQNKYIFPHTTNQTSATNLSADNYDVNMANLADNGKVWADASPKRVGDTYAIPVSYKSNLDSYIFYAPNNQSATPLTSDLVSGNNFTGYHVILPTDPDSLLSAVPVRKYIAPNNAETTFTVPIYSKVEWKAYNSDTEKELSLEQTTDTAAKTVTFTIPAGLTYNIEIRAMGENDPITVHAMAVMNGEWTEIGTLTTNKRSKIWDNKYTSNRYYVTPEQLETLYGQFGFDAAAYNGERIFANNTATGTNIWTDMASTKTNGVWAIPLTNQTCYVYYVPKDSQGKLTAGSYNIAYNDATMLAENNLGTYYGLVPTDPSGVVKNLPASQFVKEGEKASVTLPLLDAVEWNTYNSETGEKITLKQTTDIRGGTVTFTVESMTCNVEIRAEVDTARATIHCMAAIGDSWQEIGILSSKKQAKWGYANRYYTTASELEEVYGALGFSAADYKKNFNAADRIFPHTDNQDYSSTAHPEYNNYIWADAVPTWSDTEQDYRIPLSTRTTIYVYYVPNNRVGEDGYSADHLLKTDSDTIQRNHFYSVRAEDPDNLKGSHELPAAQYLKEGGSTTITLPSISGTQWTAFADDSTGKELDLAYTKNSDGSLTYEISKIKTSIRFRLMLESDTVLLKCFAAVEGEENGWKAMQTIAIPQTQQMTWDDGKVHYYVTASQLEEVYGVLGFQKADYHGERIFPHTVAGDRKQMWADQVPKLVNGEYYIALGTIKTNYVYYVPHNLKGNADYFENNKPVSDETILANNTFYMVEPTDPRGILALLQKDLPSPVYLQKGASATVTVPKPGEENASWKAYAYGDKTPVSLTFVENSDGTITYSVPNIAQSIELRLMWNYDAPEIVYEASVEPSLAKLGKYETTQLQVVEDGKVEGETTYEHAITDADSLPYVLKAPDADRVEMRLTDEYQQTYQNDTSFNNPRYYYTFQGWKISANGTTKILQPGAKLRESDLEAYKDSSNVVTLQAVWKAYDTNGWITSVNFFISLKCEIRDSKSDGVQPAPVTDFTKSVYTTRIFGTETIPSAPKAGYFMTAREDSQANAYAVDNIIRESTKTPIENDDKASTTLEDFPSDEDVLAKIREQGSTIQLDGKTIATDQLTTKNFTVRWYVVKYQDDGWHIDGVLVAKEGRVVVKKTFVGDSTAIAEVKKKYSITGTHMEDGEKVEDGLLVLKPRAQADREEEEENGVVNYVGYDEYDAETDTYTWILTTRQDRTYTFWENSYVAPDTDTQKWTTTARYKISNSDDAIFDWQPYESEDGVSVTAQAYASDVPTSACQTIELQNMYVQAGLLTLSKVDYTTGHGMRDVTFTISQADTHKGVLKLYRKPGTSQYTTDETNAEAEGYTDLIADNQLTTSANGNIYIKLAILEAGQTEQSYYLEENVPLGYDAAQKIMVTVSDKGTINTASTVIAGSGETVPPEDGWITGEGSAILTIRNQSKILTTVTAQKDWVNTAEADRKPVQVELWRNGAKISGEEYTQELNAENNWQYVWKDLPLFVDGSVAQYSLREVTIGDTVYDPDVAQDGYAEYMVSYDATLYKEKPTDTYGTDPYWKDASGQWHYAKHALLVVHNEPIRGKIGFTKVDELNRPLKGARFALFADADCTQSLNEVTSTENGFVVFDSQPAGTYYFKEIKAPDGYKADTDTVYEVKVANGIAAITKVGGDGTTITQIQNKSNMALVLKKVSAEDRGKTLPGATFQLWRVNEGMEDTLQGTYTVGEDGTVGVSELPAGTYRVEETRAPNGYQVRTDTATIQVANGNIALAQGNTNIWQLSNTDGRFVLTVANQGMFILPTAGGPGLYDPIFVGTLLMCLAAGLGLWKKRKGSK